MGQNRAKKNRGSSSAHSLKWRKLLIKIGVTVGISIVVAILCYFMWKSPAYADAISDIYLAILSTGIGSELVLFIAGILDKKKEEEERSGYIYYAIVVAIAMVILTICLIAARGYWGEHESRSQEKNAEEAMTENTAVGEKQSLEQKDSAKDMNGFSWIKNIYIIDSSDYFVVARDKTDGLVILIENYLECYPGIDGNIVQKSDEELNAGDYGDYIALAEKYAQDIEACGMEDVKVYALEKEIEQRELAYEEYKKYDNLKILGDCYLCMISWCELSNSKKQEILENALRYYIEALACAYNDPKASKSYISGIWDAVIGIYKQLSGLDTPTLDESHQEQALDMAKACERCKQNFLSDPFFSAMAASFSAITLS